MPRPTSAWPPILGSLAALAVFFGVLLSTPLGLGAVPALLERASRNFAPSYAVGAAATLALGALLLVTAALALVETAVRWRRQRDSSQR